jgi:hypothetical protein
MGILEETILREELEKGGQWLGTARSWMQQNIRNGSTLNWSSTEMVQIPFNSLEDFAKEVAVAAILEDRKKAFSFGSHRKI